MAKVKISQYDATAGNNTDIDSISIAEGMLPSNVNNALRELMAHLKDMDAGTQALTSPQLTSVDINGGTIDGAIIGGSSAAAISGTTLALSGLATVGGTLGVTGAVTANAGVVVDEMTLDGDTLTATDTFTIDAVDDITLNSDNSGRILFGDASIIYGIASNSSSDFVLEVGTSDKDILFKGQDGGASITALTLDMSDAGTAIFNHDAKFADAAQIIMGAGEDIIITSDGANANILAANGNMTIDCAGNLFLDGDGSLIIFRDGGLEYGRVGNNSSNFYLTSLVQDKDIVFTGNDNGTIITALTLDMSDAGTAKFNSKIVTGLGSGYATDADITLGSGAPAIFFHDTGGGENNASIEVNNGAMLFRNGGTGTNVSNLTERVRISNAGHMYFITSGNEPSNSQTGVRVSGIDGQNFWKSANSGTSAYNQLAFFNGNGNVGNIQTNGTATSYFTSSDYRLKENVDYDWDATTRLKQLKPARFNFIADADTTVDGFLAHEAQAVVPEAVSGTKDAVEVWKEHEELPDGVSVGDNKLDADGNTTPEMQGIDQAKLVPLLTKTILELEARITALEG